VQIRPIRDLDEAARLEAETHNAVHADDRVLPEDLAGWIAALDDPAFFVAEEDGRELGSAWVSVERGRPTPEARVLVRAEHRNRGVGSALFEAISVAARERGHSHVEARVRETAPEGLEFALHRGFEEIGREFGLELDLTAIEAPEVVPPAGVEIVTWAERPDLVRGIYEVAGEAYPDVPGEEENRMASFEDWLAADMGGTGDRPEATFVAVADGEVVGYAKFSLTDAQPTTAYHDMTGVRRSWRGRGVAGALKAAELRWAKEQGYERLRTQNEERNTPIRRLNERFGYRPAPGRILLRGPVAPG
jgi:GNAT superfamily N-acetyltransferase